MQYMKGQFESKATKPEVVMQDSVAYYNHNKQLDALSPDVKDFDNLDYDRALELYRQLFNNAGEFTFTFVGSFDEATIRPLIEKYIASLPSSKKKAELVDMRNYTKGKVQKSFSFKMSNPQSKIIDTYRSEKVPYTLDNLLNSKALSQYLWNKMFEIIREKESAVYTPMPRVSLENDLTGSYITIGCELATNPEKQSLPRSSQRRLSSMHRQR